MEVIFITLVVLATFTLIYRKIGALMSTVQDLQTDVQAIEDGVKALAVLISDLRAAGPGPVTQAQLDALDVEAKAIVTAINAAK